VPELHLLPNAMMDHKLNKHSIKFITEVIRRGLCSHSIVKWGL